MTGTQFYQKINKGFEKINDHQLAELTREGRLGEVYFEIKDGEFANLVDTNIRFIQAIQAKEAEEIRTNVDDEMRYT